MSALDTRILEMRFENTRFEQHANQTLSTLDKLKSALNFDKAKESISGLEKQANNFQIGGMVKAVDTITARFDALGVVALTTLTNITNRAISAGEQLVKSFTIDPIKMGMQEYETQINAVQTILANTQKEGTNVAQVNAALDELNTYADMTIYNFTEMTRNIGTFTAAGVKLDDSVKAIKGIANLAAASGSNSEQASRAMYQLSQAMAAGKVNLQDWNSVVNAGMGGQMFQDSLMETARVHGIAIDQMVKDQGSFRETLQKGWLTTEVLTETLQKFTGDLSREELRQLGYSEEQIDAIVKMGVTANDAATKVKTFTQLIDTLQEAAQSGWTGAWRIIIGDFEEAKEVWTTASNELSDIINTMSNERIAKLTDWSKRGGRTLGLMAIRNVFDSLVLTVSSLKTGFERVFEPLSGQKLYDITLKITNLTEKFKANETTAYNLRHIARGLAAAFDLLLTPVELVVNIMTKLLGAVIPASGGVMSMAANLGDLIYQIDQAVKNSGAFEGVLSAIDTLLKPLGETLEKASDAVSGFFDSFFRWNLTKFEEVASAVDGVGESTGGFFEKIKEAYLPVHKFLSERLEPILERFYELKDTVIQVISGITSADIMFAFTATGLATVIKKAVDLIDEIIEKFKKGPGDTKGFLDSIKDVLGGVSESLQSFQDNLKSEVLIKIAKAIGILAVSLFAISIIPKEQLATSLGAITALFGDMFVAMFLFTKLLSKGAIKGLITMSASFISLSTSLVILSVAMNMLAKLKWDEIGRGVAGLAAELTVLIVAAKLIDRTGTFAMKRAAKALVVFAAAIVVLSEAVRRMGELDWDKLVKGLTGVGVLCAELLVFLKLLNGGMTMKGATALIVLGGAINVLALAVGSLGEMKVEELAKGVIALGVILGELAAFTALTNGKKTLVTSAAGLVVLALAVQQLVEPIGELGKMTLGQIAKGLSAMGVALGEIAVAMKLLPTSTIIKSAGLVVLAYTLTTLVDVFKGFGEMKWGEIGAAIVSLGGSLLIIAGAMKIMTGTISGATAMFFMTGSLENLLEVLKGYAEEGFAGLGEGILLIATTLGVLAGTLSVLSPAMSSIAGPTAMFSVSMTLLSVGLGMFLDVIKGFSAVGFGTVAEGLIGISVALVALVGVAALLSPFTMSLMSLAVSMAVFSASIFTTSVSIALLSASLGALTTTLGIQGTAISTFLVTIIPLIPDLVAKLGEGFVLLLQTIADSVEPLGEAVFKIGEVIIDVITELAPKLVESLVKLLVEMLQTLAEYTPQIIDAGAEFIKALLQGLKDELGPAIATAIEHFGEFIDGIVEGVGEMLGKIKDTGARIFTSIKDGMFSKKQDIVDTTDEAVEAMKLKVEESNTPFESLGSDIISNLVNGFKKKDKEPLETINNILQKCLGEAKKTYEDWVETGKLFTAGIAKGIRDNKSEAINAAIEVARAALRAAQEELAIESPSKKAAKLGKYTVEGFANGLLLYSSVAEDASRSMAKGTLEQISNAIENSNKSGLGLDLDVNPVITPVLDLSQIESRKGELDAALRPKEISLATSRMASSITRAMGVVDAKRTDATSESESKPTEIIFNQNNYSPKALSRIEIYRQTRNQLSGLKGVII